MTPNAPRSTSAPIIEHKIVKVTQRQVVVRCGFCGGAGKHPLYGFMDCGPCDGVGWYRTTETTTETATP